MWAEAPGLGGAAIEAGRQVDYRVYSIKYKAGRRVDYSGRRPALIGRSHRSMLSTKVCLAHSDVSQ